MSGEASANQTYGALTEGFFFAGFTFERAMAQTLALLKGDGWRLVGDGFDDVNEFIRSLNLDKLRVIAEQRKEFAQCVRQLQPAVSNRAIAGALGVSPMTIGRDLETNVTPKPLNAPENEESRVTNVTPTPTLAGAAAAKLVAKREKRAFAKERRQEREADLGARQLALPERRYGVIYADPPWKFEVYSEDTGQGRAAEAHYETAALPDIKAIDVLSIAADDCVLFMWSTAPTLPEALELLTAWGFAYRTHCVWAKNMIGLGFWFRNQHEILIVAVKGKVPAPAHGTQFSSLVEAPRAKHSEKPEVFYELIESYFPTLPKIELFARKARAGWDCWGKEAPVTEAAE